MSRGGNCRAAVMVNIVNTAQLTVMNLVPPPVPIPDVVNSSPMRGTAGMHAMMHVVMMAMRNRRGSLCGGRDDSRQHQRESEGG